MFWLAVLMDSRTPCLIGIAQRTIREQPGPEPLDLWESVAREAAEDARLPPDRLGSIQIVWTDSWQYDSPVGRLAERLGAHPRHRAYSAVGGTAPQRLIGEAAAGIAAGEFDSALVAGAEALATRRAYRKAGEHAPWSHPADPKPPYGWERPPHPSALAHGLFLPVHTYPIMETARRARLGLTIEEEMSERARIMAPMTEVAAANPYAWRRTARTADELAADRRFVGWPYTRSTVAVLEVDQAAAVVLAGAGLADRLGVPEEQRIYLRGWAYAEDTWEVAARPDLASSTAAGAAARAAFERAGLELGDMDALDVYSCFAIALRQACDAFGLDPCDPRGLTVTGGLPYAGGPASDYVLHATATMAGLLRARPGHGMVTGVGMHLTKHTCAVWSSEPGGRLGDPSPVHVAREVPVVSACSGSGVVAGYTVAHGRDGVVEKGFAVVEVPGGRAYAVIEDEALATEAEQRELVGQEVRVSTDGKVNVARW